MSVYNEYLKDILFEKYIINISKMFVLDLNWKKIWIIILIKYNETLFEIHKWKYIEK